MRTSEGGKRAGRKRHVNIIYFLDSARTRTIKIPLGRASLVMVLIVLVGSWSLASTLIIASLYNHNIDLTNRLHASLATIFEYESKHEGIYEIAYPANDRRSKAPSPAALTEAIPAPGEPVAVAATPSTAKSAAVETQPRALAAKAAPPKAGAKPDSTSSSNPETSSTEALQTATQVASKTIQDNIDPKHTAPPHTVPPNTAPSEAAQKEPDGLPRIIVANPVLEARTSDLELRFDITNKTGLLAEGFIWAIAEFRSDQNETVYIAAPEGIGILSNGEPQFPMRSARFAIRNYKKKMFNFPFIKGQSGTFVGVRIGTIDKTGSDKMTYNVPVEIRVQTKNASESPSVSTNGAKPG